MRGQSSSIWYIHDFRKLITLLSVKSSAHPQNLRAVTSSQRLCQYCPRLAVRAECTQNRATHQPGQSRGHRKTRGAIQGKAVVPSWSPAPSCRPCGVGRRRCCLQSAFWAPCPPSLSLLHHPAFGVGHNTNRQRGRSILEAVGIGVGCEDSPDIQTYWNDMATGPAQSQEARPEHERDRFPSR